MDALLSQAIEQQADFNRKTNKARISRDLFTSIMTARPSLQGNWPIAQKIAQGVVETMFWSGTRLNLDAGGGVFIDLSANANKFALWEAQEGTGGTAGLNVANANQLDVIFWAGLVLNFDVQSPTLQQIEQLGKVIIQYGEQQRPNRNIVLQDFLVRPYYRVFDLNTATTGVAQGVIPEPFLGGFFFDRNEPMVVVPSDSRPLLQIDGLAAGAAIAGAAPNLNLQLVVRGVRVRL